MAGTVFVITSVRVIGVWFGLECNFFGFIPLLNGKTTEEREGAMKYFIIQGLGSSFIFAGVCLIMREGWKGDGPLFSFIGAFIFLIGIIIKVGLFPFHFWFPRIIGGRRWFNCFILRTWQKLGVFFVVRGIRITSRVRGLIIIRALATRIIGGAGGVGQVYFRSILAYSSLVHSG